MLNLDPPQSRLKILTIRSAWHAVFPHQQQVGFTLLEMIVALVIVSIVTALSVPAAVQLYSSYHRSGAEQLIAADMVRASSRATVLGTRIVLTIAPGGRSYSIGPDYLPYETPAAAETIEMTRTLPRAITVTPTQTLIFNSRGFLVDASDRPTESHLVLNEDQVAFSNLTITPIGSVTIN